MKYIFNDKKFTTYNWIAMVSKKWPYYIVKTQSFPTHGSILLCAVRLASNLSTHTHSCWETGGGDTACNISRRAFRLLLKGVKGSLSEALTPEAIY